MATLNIGPHLSNSKGYMNMLKEADTIGATTFQFFTRNPRGGSIKPINHADIDAFRAEWKHGVILAHAPYTINPCSADERVREFALNTMKEDISRMELIPGNLYNFHPGSHVKQGVDVAIPMICAHLDQVLYPEMQTTVLLETMAGKGSEVGRSFDELKRIIDGTKLGSQLGVCFDTCHVYDAGYDIVNDLNGVLAEFDRIIGLDKLKAIHINDSKNPFASHKDRHEKIGEGSIGIEAFRLIVNHPNLRDLPFYLETPNDLAGYKAEIELLRSLYE